MPVGSGMSTKVCEYLRGGAAASASIFRCPHTSTSTPLPEVGWQSRLVTWCATCVNGSPCQAPLRQLPAPAGTPHSLARLPRRALSRLLLTASVSCQTSPLCRCLPASFAGDGKDWAARKQDDALQYHAYCAVLRTTHARGSRAGPTCSFSTIACAPWIFSPSHENLIQHDHGQRHTPAHECDQTC